MSPEPFSTIAVSSLEELLMAGVSYLVATHPLVAFAIAIVLLAAGVALVLAIRRRIARFLERVRVRR
jgi:O-antigen/teichoic acid export membrane protein